MLLKSSTYIQNFMYMQWAWATMNRQIPIRAGRPDANDDDDDDDRRQMWSPRVCRWNGALVRVIVSPSSSSAGGLRLQSVRAGGGEGVNFILWSVRQTPPSHRHQHGLQFVSVLNHGRADWSTDWCRSMTISDILGAQPRTAFAVWGQIYCFIVSLILVAHRDKQRGKCDPLHA